MNNKVKLDRANRLLNDACEIITQLEHNADEGQMKSINIMFDEIKYADQIDDEMKASSYNELADYIDDDICDVIDKYIRSGFISKNGEQFFNDDAICEVFNHHVNGLKALVRNTYDTTDNIEADAEAQDYETFGDKKI